MGSQVTSSKAVEGFVKHVTSDTTGFHSLCGAVARLLGASMYGGSDRVTERLQNRLKNYYPLWVIEAFSSRVSQRSPIII